MHDLLKAPLLTPIKLQQKFMVLIQSIPLTDCEECDPTFLSQQVQNPLEINTDCTGCLIYQFLETKNSLPRIAKSGLW